MFTSIAIAPANFAIINAAAAAGAAYLCAPGTKWDGQAVSLIEDAKLQGGGTEVAVLLPEGWVGNLYENWVIICLGAAPAAADEVVVELSRDQKTGSHAWLNNPGYAYKGSLYFKSGEFGWFVQDAQRRTAYVKSSDSSLIPAPVLAFHCARQR